MMMMIIIMIIIMMMYDDGWLWKGRKQPLSDHPSPGTPLHLNLHHEDDEGDDD